MKDLVVNLGEHSYPIYIKHNLLKNIGNEIKKIYNNKKIVIITDTNISKIYGKILAMSLKKEGFIVKFIIIKAGEKSKSLETLNYVYSEFIDFELSRDDLIITFGGGVVGDLGGFAAATYLRGVPFIQIPTSLLAQIDSSIGGKVAVNLKEGKNLIGSFYQPKSVFIDPILIKTLERRYFIDGLGEVIKYAAIKDSELFNLLINYKCSEEVYKDIDEIIYRCIKTKKQIVELDENDTGERMLLNFGHTLGHAIEKYFKYEVYSHGEAVSMGMYLITKNSEELGITKKGTANLIKEVLIKYSLPYKFSNIDENEIFKIVSLDKKSTGDSLNIILLNEIGDSFIKKIDKKDIPLYLHL